MRSQTPMILAIDFDDTIAKSNFPAIVRAKKNATKYLNKLYERGYYIIVWTCRHGVHQDMAKDWLNENGIKFHAINSHHPTLVDFYKNDTRKISADIYIDDKSLLFLFHPGWRTLYYLIRLKRLFIKSKVLDQCKIS